MKGKAIIPLVLGLGVGLVAVKLGVDTIRESKASVTKQETVTAFRATADIDAFAEITAEMIEEVKTEVNAFLPTEELFETSKDVVGRVTARMIPKGSPVLKSYLAPPGTDVGIQGAIEPGYLAYSVEIDEVSSVAYQLKRGTWVDVIVVMDVEGERRKKETISEVLLQHVQVLAVGRSTPGAQPAEGSAPPKAAKSVTLHVPETDVPKLHWAATRGKIALAMRGDNEPAVADRTSGRLEDMFQKSQQQERPDQGSEPRDTSQPSKWQSFWGSFAQAGTEGDAQTAAPTASEADSEPPHEVVVVRASGGKGGVTVETKVFENAHSRKVVTADQGKQSAQGSSPSAGRSRRPVPGPGVRTDKPDQLPADQQAQDDSDTGEESE